MRVKTSDLQVMVERLISKRFYSKADAQKIAEVLIYAELTGKGTQGVLKLVSANPVLQDIKPEHAPKIIRETPLSAVFDAGAGIGILAAQMATDRLIEIAGRSGFGITAMRNYSSSTGAIGYFARKIAKKDLICIIATNSPSTVAHFGGIEPTYGTNPMAFGFPTADNPIVFDMAASAITYFGLVQAKALGQSIPDDVAIDREGNPTTDPAAAMKGSILPFDRSYKGSGLAMVVELLAGVASGASYIFDKGDWGSTFMAFSPSLLMDVVEFKRRSSDLVAKIKAKRTSSGKPARIPGYDLEDEMQRRIESGEVDLPEEIFEKIRSLDQLAAAT